MKNNIIVILLFNSLVLFISCFKTPTPKISIFYKAKVEKNNVIRIDYFLKNNDSIDYFIPLIKPAFKYTSLYYNDSSKWIQIGIDPDFLLANKAITRADLLETAEIDSMEYLSESDSVVFHFENSFVKTYYDSLLSKFEDKEKLRFIYPFFYHVIGNGCIYLLSGEVKKITAFAYHSYPISIKDLRILFYFNTDSITDYSEEYFKKIPNEIGTYHLFNGLIKN